MQTMEQFLEFFRIQRRATRTLVDAVPTEHFDWAPSPSAFSCAGLVRHLMQSEVFWRRLLAAAARGEPYDPFNLTGNATERLTALREGNLRSSGSEKFGTSVRACLDLWAEIQAKTERELASWPPEAMVARVTHPLAVMEGPLWEALLFFVAHEVHHRGQLSAYLKVLGVEQPASLF
jgi:uncharacterized damage-inducible protein DinB